MLWFLGVLLAGSLGVNLGWYIAFCIYRDDCNGRVASVKHELKDLKYDYEQKRKLAEERLHENKSLRASILNLLDEE